MSENNSKITSSYYLEKLTQKLLSYKPLIIIIIFCLILPFCHQGSENFMYRFMGYFFIFLSMFKFFDLKGFVDGFSSYDLMAKHFKTYGYIYPFIEFFLGISYLLEIWPVLANYLTLIIMIISGIGVIKSIFSGQKIKCACLGTVLNVPLSTVSILENFGMGAMAAYKLNYLF